MRRILVKTYWWVSLLAGLACLPAVPVWGSPLVATPQVTPKRVFKVCLLLLESQKNSAGTAKYWNSDPWILPVLNRSPYKPAGWIIDNPLAPGLLPDDHPLIISGNYYSKDGKGGSKTTALEGGTDASNPNLSFPTNWYLNGRRRDADGKLTNPKITKDDPAYWVVKLDQKSIDALVQFDLVIVNGHSQSTLTNGDRDNLQLLLNRGATIWLNNSQREGNQLTNFFLDPPIVMHRGPYTDTTNNAQLTCVDPESWLMKGYYSLNDADVTHLRDNKSENSYIVSGFGGLIGEVVRLYSNNLPYPNGGKPTIAAGRVGAGQLIATGTDVVGGTADWWEFLHNNDTANAWPLSTLGTAPYFNTSGTQQGLSRPRSYVSCCKLFFNMLARPSTWHMVGGNVLGSRFFPQAFSTALLRNWTMPLTMLSDPVVNGDYVAASGISRTGRKQIQVYRLADVTSDQAMLPCFDFDAKTTTQHNWCGSPVFNRIITGTNSVPQTVFYALEGYYSTNSQCWMLKPRCFYADTGNEPAGWSTVQPLAIPTASDDGIPSASMTLSNNRLVVTVFGRTTNNAGNRIFIYDATKGDLGAVIGADPGWGLNFRLTGPASIITAPVDFELKPQETGDMRITGTGGSEHRKEMVELLAVTGEVFSGVDSYPVLFLIPPMAIAKFNPRTVSGNYTTYGTVPATISLRSGTTGTEIPIGIGNAMLNDFRRRNIVAVKYSGSTFNVVFRNFDVFVSQGPTAPAKLSVTSVKPLVLTYPVTGSGGTTQNTSISMTKLAMGYPIVLYGTQQLALGNRLTLRANDGDGVNTFGYAVDIPPIINGNQLILGTNSLQQKGRPFLQRFRAQDLGQQAITGPTDPRLGTNLAIGGTLTAYRIASPELTPFAFPEGKTAGDIIWQFYGNSFGPKAYSETDDDILPRLWHSDFPLGAAVGKDAVYTVGFFDRAYSGKMTGEMGTPLTLPANNSGAVLYALDPAPSRYLEQVVTAGTGVAAVAGNSYQLRVNLGATQNYALRSGARALLRYATGTWDMGRITQIRGTGDPYTITFDRACPGAAIWNGAGGTLLVATSVPYLSHVQAWDQVTGAAVVENYTRGNTTMTRISQGILGHYQADAGVANPFDPAHGEMMLSFTQLHDTCHTAVEYAGTTAKPEDGVFPAEDWAKQYFLTLPRTGGQGMQGVPTASTSGGAFNHAKTASNYFVDYRAGRVELNPLSAGQYADRFVVVHYLTKEKNPAGVNQQVHHAEVMHVPTQVKWQYEFGDAVPDSSPTVVNDTIYVTVNQRVMINNTPGWQPMIFAFDTHPENPLQVQPKWKQPVGPSATNMAVPYRGVTGATPIANGVLVGTGLNGPNGTIGNQLSLFQDRGTLIADGHRIIRVNGDGQVTWQASATQDYDLLAQAAPDNATKGAGLAQQDFTLISRIQRLKSGNILVCDTGGNRVVEMDRDGNAIWQYPDSDLILDSSTTPVNLRLNGPRDARRYEVERTSPDGTVTIRWEITLIADTGNNRIIEVRRPYVRYENATVQGAGYQYQPALTISNVSMRQAQEVIADGKTITFNGKSLAQPLSFTIARRCPSATKTADYNGLDDANWVLDDVRSYQVLAVVGNAVPDPVQKDGYLRTAVLERPDKDTPMTVKPSTTPDKNGANALRVRKHFPYDFVNVRQLDIITLNDGGTLVPYVLVVDQTGVREVPWAAQDTPVFEMVQSIKLDYPNNLDRCSFTNALSTASWSGVRATLTATDRTKLDNWLANDQLFAPVAVMRIDSGSRSTADRHNVRYVIAQMNTLTPRDDANRRIYLFEARHNDTLNSWGIVDASNNYYLYPNPLSPDYPNLPGTTYPLTQPLCIDRD